MYATALKARPRVDSRVSVCCLSTAIDVVQVVGCVLLERIGLLCPESMEGRFLSGLTDPYLYIIVLISVEIRGLSCLGMELLVLPFQDLVLVFSLLLISIFVLCGHQYV